MERLKWDEKSRKYTPWGGSWSEPMGTKDMPWIVRRAAPPRLRMLVPPRPPPPPPPPPLEDAAAAEEAAAAAPAPSLRRILIFATGGRVKLVSCVVLLRTKSEVLDLWVAKPFRVGLKWVMEIKVSGTHFHKMHKMRRYDPGALVRVAV